MISPALPLNERARVQDLHDYHLSDAPGIEPLLDDLAALAAKICGTGYSLINFIDSGRHWLKAAYGLQDLREIPRENGFCSHVIAQGGYTEVADLREDERFSGNPFVVESPGFRFYAALPLVNAAGHALGTLVVLDTAPRVLNEDQRRSLAQLAALVVSVAESCRLAWQKQWNESRWRDAIAEREAHYRALFEQATVGISYMTLDGGVSQVNAKWMEITGYGEKQLEGLTLAALTHPGDLADNMRLLHRLAAGEIDTYTLDKRLLRPDGTLVWATVTVSAYRDPATGEPRHVVAVVQDITARKQAEEALAAQTLKLAESEANLRQQSGLLQLILDNIADGIAVINLDGEFTHCNPAGQSVVRMVEGVRLDDWPEAYGGRRMDGAPLAPGDFPIRRALRGETVDAMEIRLRHPHRPGDMVLSVNARPLPDGQGRIQGAVAAWRDITDLHAADQALQAANERTRQLLESIHDAFFALDNDWRFTYVNTEAQRLLGHPAATLLGQNVWRMFPDAAGTDFERNYRRAKAENRKVEFETSYAPLHLWLSVHAYPHDEGLSVYFRDVTEQKKARQALLRAEEHFRILVEGTRDYAIFMLDQDGCVVSWNPGAQRLLGYAEGEIVGRHFSLFYTANERELAPARRLRRAAREGRVEEDGWRCRKDGRHVWMTGVLEAAREADGSLRGFIKILRDNTERKAAMDALLQAREELEERVRGRTRELRTANRSLLELSNHLQKAREEERTRIAREIHDELGGILTALKFDLSARAAADAGDQGRRPLTLLDNAIASLRRIINDLRPSILDNLGLWAALEWLAQSFSDNMGIPCRISLDGPEHALEPDRATDIFRIAQESLTNVARHAKATRVDIAVVNDDACVSLTVRDNGCGISEERLFAAKSYGLLGMQERARSLDGTLRIYGAPGAGTTLLLLVPVQRPETGTEAAPREEMRLPHAPSISSRYEV